MQNGKANNAMTANIRYHNLVRIQVQTFEVTGGSVSHELHQMVCVHSGDLGNVLYGPLIDDREQRSPATPSRALSFRSPTRDCSRQ